MNTYRSLAIFLILMLSFSAPALATEYQFQSVVEKLIPHDKDFKNIEINKDDIVEGVIEFKQIDKAKYVNEGVFEWSFAATNFKVNEPLNLVFAGGHLRTNQSMEQTTMEYLKHRCEAQETESCGISGSPLKVANRTDLSVSSFLPVNYLLTQSGLKQADLDFQQVVDHFLKNVSEGGTKVLLKFVNETDPDDYIRIILNITEVKAVSKQEI